jgi:SAM-dependent methyltransferase
MMKQQRQATPAEAYQEYYGPAIFEPLANVVLDHVRPAPGDRVLDVACGTGIVARRVAGIVGPTGQVVGVDVNPGMIDVARAMPTPEDVPIEYHQGDAQALDLPDATFDFVVCQQGVQFFPDRLAGLREMRRVLGDGGRAAIAVWRGLDEHPLYAALADAEVPHLAAVGVNVTRDEVVAPFSFGSATAVCDLLAEAGFGDVSVVPRSIEARFATPDRFVERLQYAYAAVIPQFVEDPGLFVDYITRISQDTKDIVEPYRQGDRIVVPMHTNVVVGQV